MDNITKILLRQDSQANWNSYNPILAEGEPAVEIIETGNGKKSIGFKIGNGIDTWDKLPYLGADVEVLSERLDTIEGNVDNNTAAIVTLQNQVLQVPINTTSINELNSDVANHTEQINTLETNLSDLAQKDEEQYHVLTTSLGLLLNKNTEDGTYILQSKIQNGNVIYEWVRQ